MTPDKICLLARRYHKELTDRHITPRRMAVSRTFGSCTEQELLEHACFLSDQMNNFVHDPSKLGKANRHLTAIQMCLSFANVYTLDELRTHNSPDI